MVSPLGLRHAPRIERGSGCARASGACSTSGRTPCIVARAVSNQTARRALTDSAKPVCSYSPLLASIPAGILLLASSVPEAAALQVEPANALSLPTWAVHVSSVTEWVVAMGLMWTYADVSGNQRWKGMTWGMLPSLGSAMAACTWHFYYNSTELEFLVALQAALTVVGNFTCWIAAWRIFKGAEEERAAAAAAPAVDAGQQQQQQ